MARQIASVHLDIARFVLEVSDFSEDSSESMEKLGRWTKRLARCLATRNPDQHEYGSFLLAEVEEYRKVDSARKKAKVSADSMERVTIPRIPHTDQSRSEQTEQTEQIRKEKDPWFSDSDFYAAWNGWIAGRKKKPTPHAIDLSITKLKKISGGSLTEAIAVLNESAANGWSGLFPLKGNSPRFNGVASPRKAEYIP